MLARAFELYGSTFLLYGLITLLGAGMLAAVLFLIAQHRRKHRSARRIRWVSRRDLNWLRAMSKDEFEQMLCKSFRHNQYIIEEVQRDASGEGVLLLLSKAELRCIALCHYYSTHKTEAAEMKRTVQLSAQHDLMPVLIVSLAGFTREARNLARGKAITLIDGARLLHMIDQGKRTSYRRRGRYVPRDRHRQPDKRAVQADFGPTTRLPQAFELASGCASAASDPTMSTPTDTPSANRNEPY